MAAAGRSRLVIGISIVTGILGVLTALHAVAMQPVDNRVVGRDDMRSAVLVLGEIDFVMLLPEDGYQGN